MNAFTIRADPGGAITDTPFVFRKTIRANGKAAATAPAKRKCFLAAMAGILFFSPLPTCCLRLGTHVSVLYLIIILMIMGLMEMKTSSFSPLDLALVQQIRAVTG